MSGGEEMMEAEDANKKQKIEENVNSEKVTKKKIRCWNFPNCSKEASECPFVHPTENCTYFPACN